MNLLRRLPPWLLLLLCVLYVLSPVDLFPDFLGLPGRFDDLLVALGTLFYLYSASGRIPGKRRTEETRSSRKGPGPADPYEVLGADRGEDFETIRRRYREKLLQYHPDRVHHLGREFQEMAERKTKEITEAFRKIARERGERP